MFKTLIQLAVAIGLIQSISALAADRCSTIYPMNVTERTQSEDVVFVSDLGLPEKSRCITAGEEDLAAQELENEIDKELASLESEEPLPQVLPPKVTTENRSIQFENNSAELSDQALNQLRNLATEAKNRELKSVRILGLADKTGSATKNLSLSERRAQAVKKAITEMGIGAELIQVKALGSEPEDASRRVDISVQ